MKHYRLVYKQPYEYDEDSPSGIGDHQIEYTQYTEEFEGCDDKNARDTVNDFLKRGGLDFGRHLGSLPAGYYPRKFVSLVEFKPDRAVEFKTDEQRSEEALHSGGCQGRYT